MNKRYEIFWFGRAGASWIDAAENFDNAKAMMEKSFAADAGGYAVLVDRENGHCITVGTGGSAADGVSIFP
jgi:hypothetical protein